MRVLLTLSLMTATLASVAACEVTVRRGPDPQVQPANPTATSDTPQAATPKPVPAPSTKANGPSGPNTAITTPAPAPTNTTPQDKVVPASAVTPSGVEAGCYNRCLQQNVMRATSPNDIKSGCKSSCSIADKCVDRSNEADCSRCCRGNRSRGATFDANRCTCL